MSIQPVPSNQTGVYPCDTSQYDKNSAADAQKEFANKLIFAQIHNVDEGYTNGINKNEMADLKKTIEKYKSSDDPEVRGYAAQMEKYLNALEIAQANPTEFHKEEIAQNNKNYERAAMYAGESPMGKMMYKQAGRTPSEGLKKAFEYRKREKELLDENVIDSAVLKESGSWLNVK